LHPGGSLKEKKPIEKLSKDRKKVQKKQYVPLVKEILAKNPKCKVKSPVCSGIAQGLHHISGRIGDKLLEKKNVVPCCNKCNLFIEENPVWARANGWKISKFSPENKTA
jgi:hypothetical protein